MSARPTPRRSGFYRLRTSRASRAAPSTTKRPMRTRCYQCLWSTQGRRRASPARRHGARAPGTFYRHRPRKTELMLRFASLALFVAAWVGDLWVAGERMPPAPATVLAAHPWPKRAPAYLFLQPRGDAPYASPCRSRFAMTAGCRPRAAHGPLPSWRIGWGDPWLVVLLNLPALVIIVLAYLWPVASTETAAILAVARQQAASTPS